MSSSPVIHLTYLFFHGFVFLWLTDIVPHTNKAISLSADTIKI